jgi:choline dehydrogenase-like flavoprotein
MLIDLYYHLTPHYCDLLPIPPSTFDVTGALTQFKDFAWPMPEAYIARGLGGCGIYNAMLYVRALEADFIRWNISGWTWAEALHIYKTIETYVIGKSFMMYCKCVNYELWGDFRQSPSLLVLELIPRDSFLHPHILNSLDPAFPLSPASVPDFHGTTGPIHTTPPGYIDPLASLFVSSAVQAGIPLTTDFNNPDGEF